MPKNSTEEQKKIKAAKAHANYIKNKAYRLEQQRIRRKELREGVRVIKHRDGTVSNKEYHNYKEQKKEEKENLEKRRQQKADWAYNNAKRKKEEKAKKILEDYAKKYPEG